MTQHRYSLTVEKFYESTRWILVNTIMCQIPILIMIAQGFSKVEILYSGLSYAVTLIIVANYTLEDSSLHGLKKTGLILWLLLCIVFLAIYQSIKIEWLNIVIHENTIRIYLFIIGISNLMAFLSSWDQLKDNAATILNKKLDQIKIETEKTKRFLTKIQTEVELEEGDL